MIRKTCFPVGKAVAFALFALVVLLFSPLTHAQTAGAGTVSGTVTDSSHAVLPGISVSVTNVDTGVAHAYTTNSDGLYVAPFLQPGHYKVTATGGGFGSVAASGLTLQVGETLTIDLTMAVQSASTT